MKKWKLIFTGRARGALGVSQRLNIIVRAEDVEGAVDRGREELSHTYEHLHAIVCRPLEEMHEEA